MVSNLMLTYKLSCDFGNFLFLWVFRGVALKSYSKVYWSKAIGFNRPNVAYLWLHLVCFMWEYVLFQGQYSVVEHCMCLNTHAKVFWHILILVAEAKNVIWMPRRNESLISINSLVSVISLSAHINIYRSFTALYKICQCRNHFQREKKLF